MGEKTPKAERRVTLSYLLSEIVHEEFIHPQSHPEMTIMVATLSNGFVIVGNSSPTTPAKFNEERGREWAREDCIRQMWRLYSFAIRFRPGAQMPPERDGTGGKIDRRPQAIMER